MYRDYDYFFVICCKKMRCPHDRVPHGIHFFSPLSIRRHRVSSLSHSAGRGMDKMHLEPITCTIGDASVTTSEGSIERISLEKYVHFHQERKVCVTFPVGKGPVLERVTMTVRAPASTMSEILNAKVRLAYVPPPPASSSSGGKDQVDGVASFEWMRRLGQSEYTVESRVATARMAARLEIVDLPADVTVKNINIAGRCDEDCLPSWLVPADKTPASVSALIATGEVAVVLGATVFKEKYEHHRRERRACVSLLRPHGTLPLVSVESVRLVITTADETTEPMRCPRLLIHASAPHRPAIECSLLFRSCTGGTSMAEGGGIVKTWMLETSGKGTSRCEAASFIEISDLPAEAVVVSIRVFAVPTAHHSSAKWDEGEEKRHAAPAVAAAKWLPVKNRHAAGGGEYHYGKGNGVIWFKFPAVRGRGDLKTIYLAFSSPAYESFVRGSRGENKYVVQATGRPPFEVDDASDVDILDIGSATVVKLYFSNILCMDVATLVRIEIPLFAAAAAQLESVAVDFYADCLLDIFSSPSSSSPPALIGGKQRQCLYRGAIYDLRGGSIDGTTFYRAPDGTVVFASVPTAEGTYLGGLFDGSGCAWKDAHVKIVVVFPRPVRMAAIEMAPDSRLAGRGTGDVRVYLGANSTMQLPAFIFSFAHMTSYIRTFSPESVEVSEMTLILRNTEVTKEIPPPATRCWLTIPGISFYTDGGAAAANIS